MINPRIRLVSMADREYVLRHLTEELARMTEEQILERFREFSFLDWDGHQLTSRIEFQALVRLAKRNNREFVVLTA